MGFLKRIALYITCFYYCILTPGTSGGDGNVEELLWETVTVSLFQAFIAAGLFYYFEWPTTMFPWITGEGFLGLLGTVGLGAGLWTLIGGLSYPMLEEILEQDQKDLRVLKRRKEAEYEALITQQRTDFRNFARQNPERAKKILADALWRHAHGRKIKKEFLKDENFVSKESTRLDRAGC